MASTDEQSASRSKHLWSRRFFAAATAALLSLSALARNAEAATVSWSGASGGSWFVAGNWSPAQVPTSADDVVIDANVIVTVPGDSPSISFNTLTLGDAGRSFTPTLKFPRRRRRPGS